MGLGSFLFGKPAKSTSENQAYGFIEDTYAPQAQGGVDAFGMLGDALGIGGNPEAANGAFQNFLNSSGFKNILDQAMRGVTNSMAGRGLLRSGATGKALQDRAAGLGQQYFGNWLNQLSGASQLGQGAGGLITNAGQTSTSTGAKQGFGSLIGAGLSFIPGMGGGA